MNSRLVAFTLVPVAVLAGSLFSRSGGTFPGSSGIPSDAARRAPSCTSCHSGTIGSAGVTTRLSVPQHSLDLNESVQVTMQVAGGPSGNDGGFVAENTGGTFAAASNTQINSTGRSGQFITHTSSNGRSWSFSFAAPNAPGLAMLYAVANAADGDGGRRGDSIAFHGFDPTATVATPVYIGVNAAGNQRLGQGCVGSFGNHAVLYSDESPAIANANYALKLAGAASNASALFLLGLPRATPLDLTAIGATGCGLWVDVLSSASVQTSNGHPQRGEGAGSTGLPIPNDAGLRGATLGAQVAIIDPSNGRTLPITLTNGLAITIQ